MIQLLQTVTKSECSLDQPTARAMNLVPLPQVGGCPLGSPLWGTGKEQWQLEAEEIPFENNKPCLGKLDAKEAQEVNEEWKEQDSAPAHKAQVNSAVAAKEHSRVHINLGLALRKL
ncbi:unnamed protein product [Nezara viridula]|uniref:Uncharacterized protein n=1 Tax=Nezara viridula TaxID=85310 RepID=A0A9P0EGT0_NEZVI|nr:unnamed protein product [Nezara viridula]